MEPGEKESEIAWRRMSRVADHFAGSIEDVAYPRCQLLPVNCSSTIKFTTPRRDNRTLFARQGSASQARFMRQVSVSQVLKSGDTALQNSPINGDSSSQFSRGAMFARPTQIVDNPPPSKLPQPSAQVNVESSTEPPNLARPLPGESGKSHLSCKTAVEISTPSGVELPPRMDVAETTSYHVITLELPGANIVDIKVEVDDKNLTVTGKRSYPRWRTETSTEDNSITYHRRQILQGPYIVVWPLPSGVDRDSISAELLDRVGLGRSNPDQDPPDLFHAAIET